ISVTSSSSTGSWRNTCLSRTRRAPQWEWRRCRAAPRSRSTASSNFRSPGARVPNAGLHSGLGTPAAPPLAARPVTSLRGVGPALADTLARLSLYTVQDLLFHLPQRYEDRTRVSPIGSLHAGARAVVEGEIQLTEIAFRGRRVLLSRIADGSGFLTLRF